jgi:hypothetical protein
MENSEVESAQEISEYNKEFHRYVINLQSQKMKRKSYQNTSTDSRHQYRNNSII